MAMTRVTESVVKTIAAATPNCSVYFSIWSGCIAKQMLSVIPIIIITAPMVVMTAQF